MFWLLHFYIDIIVIIIYYYYYYYYYYYNMGNLKQYQLRNGKWDLHALDVNNTQNLCMMGGIH